MRCKGAKFQKGFTLIELMIAITLGLILSAGMINLFVNSNQIYRVNENMSRLQENARFAMSFLARDIRRTDFRCDTDPQLLTAVDGENDTGLNGSDTITLIWQTGDVCTLPDTNTTVIYSVQNGASGIPSLFRSSDGNDVELIEGIENLQILYGEETATGSTIDYTPDYYVNAASTADMSDVISLRVVLTARTIDDNVAIGGGRITRAVTSTLALRNRLP
jgi:type IV pilus assembly protein PilW